MFLCSPVALPQLAWCHINTIIAIIYFLTQDPLYNENESSGMKRSFWNAKLPFKVIHLERQETCSKTDILLPTLLQNLSPDSTPSWGGCHTPFRAHIRIVMGAINI